FTTGSDLVFAINGTTFDTQYEQLNVVGRVDLTGVDLVLSGSHSPAVGNSFVVVNNDGTDAIVGTFSGLPEAGFLNIPSSDLSYQITYRGGDGNDVVAQVVEADPILEGTSDDDTLLLKHSGANLQLTLNGSVVWSVPFGQLNSLTINSLAGNDTLTVELLGGPVTPPAGLLFDGGLSSGVGDKLTINGPIYGFVTYNYTDHQSGSVTSNSRAVSYQGLEQLTYTNPSLVAVFNLPPAGQNAVVLGDDGTAGNSLSRLSGITITPTDFSNPSGSFTLLPGIADDHVTVNSLPDLTTQVRIGDLGKEFGAVTIAEKVAMGLNRSLIASAGMISANAGVTTQGGSIIFNAKQDISLDGPLLSIEGTISLTADSDGNGSGIVALAEGYSIDADSGKVSIIAADVDIQGTISSNSLIQLGTVQTGRPINLGTNASDAFSISTEELNLFSADLLRVGSATSGDITVAAGIDLTNRSSPVSMLQLITSGAIVDGNLSSVDVVVASLDMVAPAGIGSPSNPLEIATVTLSADSSAGSGSQFFAEVDDVTIGINGLNAQSGKIRVEATSIEVASPVTTSAGDIVIAHAPMRSPGAGWCEK
ncbi:MAG: hypothetical protein SGJ20_19830, partial [Planctomycetota bacterium]|nr:hypothetical protein [Planctomycetota bacterium]